MEGTITCAMIVKNEARNLKNCLDSLKGRVDEIVVVDTGSTDGTQEIARRYTDKVYSYAWNDDFSAARNFAIEKASGEWILYLDADEELVPGTGDLKRLIAGRENLEAYLLPLHYPITEAAGEHNCFLVLRLFRNNGRYRFQGKIHEQIALSEKEVAGIAEEPVISHKMLPSGDRNRRRGRNLTLLKKACSNDPENPFLQYYLGVEWLGLGKPGQALPYFRQAYLNLTDDQLLFRGPALRYLILSLKALGRLDEAICLCLEADLKYPEFTDIYYLGGVLFEEKKEYPLAIKWFNQAVRCGTPPALFTHMNGSGSFLACYHLGYCHQMLGQAEAAKKWYEEALDANPDYFYPVHSLFLAVLAMSGPGQALEYFKWKGYLSRTEMALAVASLFFTAGYPDLARRCLEECTAKRKGPDDFQFYLGKYNLYSGRLQRGLKILNQVSEKSQLYLQSIIHRTVALLLLGRIEEGRALALDLWRKPAARPHALILLSLIRLVEKGGMVSCPEKVSGVDTAGIALEILDQCGQCLTNWREQKNPRFFRLVNALESIVKGASPRGYLSLLEYYRVKAAGARSFCEYKFGSGGSRP